jgi:hypothetical protein
MGTTACRLHWLLPALSLTVVSALDTVPVEWGPLWQAQSPARERHPSLFFDLVDRPRILARTTIPPTDDWWRNYVAAGSASALAVQWWLSGNEAGAFGLPSGGGGGGADRAGE